ncbi:hypothetical protein PG984_008604 [Apiospora sp. TS-2023a]
MPTHGHAVAAVNGNTVAETDVYEVVEGNVYFPRAPSRASTSARRTTAPTVPGRGTRATTQSLSVVRTPMTWPLLPSAGDELKNAAWYYPETKEKAAHFKDYVAFYKTKVNVSTD